MLSRRSFVKNLARTGLTAATAPLWFHETSARAFAQTAGTYKAIVVVTLSGGNDSNNMIIPLDQAAYSEYASIRPLIAIPRQNCLPLVQGNGQGLYGLHPSLSNVATLFNQGHALAVANVGPLVTPVTKSQLVSSPNLAPEALLSHPSGMAQWESASTVTLPDSGWGGRMADLLISQSGSLPPVLDAGPASIFTVGRSVQGVAVQSGGNNLVPLPNGIASAITQIAAADSQSHNNLISQVARLRAGAQVQQALLQNAKLAGNSLKTVFPNSNVGQVMGTIAQLINGRSVIGASRQIFYCQQGGYDTHGDQLGTHAALLAELDGGIGALVTALNEMGLQDSVLLCTHSDFNRTLLGNGSGGSDHAWGSHQFIVGGGIRGGRIIGTIPEPELGGSNDFDNYGVWIPTLSVTQMTSAIGSWMGLSNAQLTTVFPDLPNFSSGPISLM